MYARIMAGIDDQFATNKVFATAVQLARTLGSRLALCHALDETPLAQHAARAALPDGVAPIVASLRATALEFLDKAAAVAREAGVDVEVKVIESERESAAELLARAAEEWRADLLIVGASASHGVGRLLAENVATRLAAKAPTTLLLVRHE